MVVGGIERPVVCGACSPACRPQPCRRARLVPSARMDLKAWRSQSSARLDLLRASTSQHRLQRADRSIRCDAAQPERSIVCIGEGLFDCLADQKGVPLEEVETWTPYPGGAPANVACALGKFGDRVVFVSALGDDDLGDEMLTLLKERGVDVKAVERLPHPTRDVLVVRALDGDRTFAGFGKAEMDQYADCFIDAEKLPEAEIRSALAVVTGSLGLSFPRTAEAMQRAVTIAKDAGVTVLVDVNWRPVFFKDPEAAPGVIKPYVDQADIVKVTEEEAEWLWGVPGDEALEDAEKVLAHLPNARGVLVTAGARGSAYAFRPAGGKPPLTARVPVLKVDVMDTTGAGDGFLGGFLHYFVKSGGVDALTSDGDELRKAVEFATACGAFVTQGPGAIAPQPDEADIEEFLSTIRDYPTPPREYFDIEAKV